MIRDIFIQGPVGLIPVVAFLGVLVWMDSYKLVRLRVVLAVIAAGSLAAWAALYFNGWVIGALGVELQTYSRYVAPLLEETLKALVIVYLFHSNRIGFLVDAAILGFAVGAGFALVENLYYLQQHGSAQPGVWVVRGFGTAIMHGGVSALFAILAQTLTERQMKIGPLYYLPGLVVAVVLHSAFNHFLVAPVLQAAGTLLVLPPLLRLVFRRSARRLHAWLELDFDADARLIETITSGEFRSSRAGRFLEDLRTRFPGPVVADMLCYLRVYTELALRAKAVLMARENELDLPLDEGTRGKFEELRYLERSIGKTGCLAMRPFLIMERKDLWQLQLLGR